MTTVINTPGTTEPADSGAGWSVAVLILLVVIGVGAYFWYYHRGAAATTTNITNVTLPPVTSPTP